MSENHTLPIFDATKPTYYFYEDGRPASYLAHAEFISGKSYPIWNEGKPSWTAYPMLDFRDMGTHYEVHLIVTSWQRKPLHLCDWLALNTPKEVERKGSV